MDPSKDPEALTGANERRLDDPIEERLGDNANKTQSSGM